MQKASLLLRDLTPSPMEEATPGRPSMSTSLSPSDEPFLEQGQALHFTLGDAVTPEICSRPIAVELNADGSSGQFGAHEQCKRLLGIHHAIGSRVEQADVLRRVVAIGMSHLPGDTYPHAIREGA